MEVQFVRRVRIDDMQLKRQTVPIGECLPPSFTHPSVLPLSYWIWSSANHLSFYLAGWHQCQALPTGGATEVHQGWKRKKELASPICKQWALGLRFRCMSPQQSFFTPATAGHSHSSILIQGAVLTLPESSLTPVKQHPLPRCPSFSSKEDLLQVSKF